MGYLYAKKSLITDMAAFEKAVKAKWSNAVLTSGTFNEVSGEIVKIEKSGTTDGGFELGDACSLSYGESDKIKITFTNGTVNEYEDDSEIDWDDLDKSSITKVEGGNLSSLTDGNNMFGYCTSLTSFTSDLSSLTDGSHMFDWCTSLTTFTSNLPSLTDGNNMFNRCTSLTTFISDLPSLTDGRSMFNSCFYLTSFTSDLSSLSDVGYMYSMFGFCISLQSVKIKCTEDNKSLMTKANLSIRSEATLEVSTDGGATWETIEE